MYIIYVHASKIKVLEFLDLIINQSVLEILIKDL